MDMREQITGLGHIGIPVRDIDDTVAFYQMIGFRVVLDTVNPQNSQKVIFLKQKDVMLELYQQEETALVAGAINHIALDVDDLDAIYRYVCEKGLNNTKDTIHQLPFWKSGVRYFTIEGPNGERIEFSQYL